MTEGTPPRSELGRAFQRLAEGDRSAAPEVFALLWPKLLRFCMRAAPLDAEDCAQKTIMKLFEEISAYDDQRSPLAWAYAIAAWECRSARKARGRSREDHVDVEPEAPADDLEERDRVRRALELVNSLPEQDRRAFEAEMNDMASSATHRQRRRRMWERLRVAWRKLYGP
jgi:RNA polymerase sigma-70 factor (ECF subfamily)